MRDETPRFVATFALWGVLLLGIGMGVAEAHVSQLEREAMAAFEAEALSIIRVTTPGAPAQAIPSATPYIIEVSVTREEFDAARAAHLRTQGRATL